MLKWFWASDDYQTEWHGPFETQESAIADFQEYRDPLDGPFHCTVAQGEPTDPADALDVEHIWGMYGDANQECSPLDDSWIAFWGLSREQIAGLELHLKTAFSDWSKAHELPTWYVVGNHESIEVRNV